MASYLRVAETITNILENRFRVFGFRFGIDPLLGLIPWLGDAISTALSCYLIWAAYQMNVPRHVIGRMIRNIVIDFVIGSVPVIGDLSDFVYKANTKNLEILRRYAAVEEGKIIPS